MGYTEADLRAHFLGQREHKSVAKQRSRANARPFNLVIDIQSKLQSKGVGYQRGASVYNHSKTWSTYEEYRKVGYSK